MPARASRASREQPTPQRPDPKYRHHRPSGRAVVSIPGEGDIYLGDFGTAASRAAYHRLIAEWNARGRNPAPPPEAPLSVEDLAALFWQHARDYYGGSVNRGELSMLKSVLRPLKSLYGTTPAKDFSPRKLKAVRQWMIDQGWARQSINKHVSRLRGVFKWGVAEELVPASILEALRAVAPLKRGRCQAVESEPVKPVPIAHVEAVLPHVSAQIGAMIRLQLLTSMRPGEVVSMRGADIDTTGKLWLYRPAKHKTQHHGHGREVYLGPQAQAVLAPFMKPDLAACLFSPIDAEAQRRSKLTASRKTPLSCGNRPGTNRKRRPRRKPRESYSVDSYRRAIGRACVKAGVPHWHPHQLRHTAATELRKRFGIEAAQVILGHRTLRVTEIYAEKNIDAAKRIAAEVG
jgi:integrase